MRFHIREAIEIAGAHRIGHGMDIMHENSPYDLLRAMRIKNILVEVNLTSNDVILGIKGEWHPFPIYRNFGVPTTLSTDDEGVNRSDLTREYLKAVLEYDLNYTDVKELSRNGLIHAFGAEKEELLAQLDAQFQDFEYRYAAGGSGF